MLNNLRILFYLPSLEMGGAEKQALQLAKWFKEREGAEVAVFGHVHAGKIAELCTANGVPWRVVPCQFSAGILSSLWALSKVGRQVRQFRPDVFLAYCAVPNVAGALLWRLVGARVFVWNQRDTLMIPVQRRLEPLAVRLTPLFVANSHHGADVLSTHYGIGRADIHVIRNGVELPVPRLDRAAWRARLELPMDIELVVMLGNLQKNKDHETLLQAWTLVSQSRQDTPAPHLALAGYEGNTYRHLRSLTEQLGVAAQVHFLGQVEDVSGLLGAADLGVYCSRQEGLPNGLLECMLAGLPVVGNDIPGMREALGEGAAEWLAPVGNAEALARLLLRLLTDADLRRTIGASNRERARAEFDLEKSSLRMRDLILDGLAKFG